MGYLYKYLYMKNIKIIVKKLQPQSLFARFLAIILIPWFTLQAITIYIFFDRHWEGVSYYMKQSLINDIRIIVRLYNDQLYQEEQIIDYAANYLSFEIKKISRQDAVNLINKSNKHKILQHLSRELQGVLDEEFGLYQDKQDQDIIIITKQRNNYYLIEIPRKRIITPTIGIFLTWIVSSAIILIVIAIIFMRNQVRSIIKLATAAESFGRGQDISNFKPEGAREVRIAGINFLKMKDRIEQQFTQRTLMLAGVSHDLKTPLTRIKLRLAMLPENSEIEAIQEDINEMQYMISEYLELISSQDELEDFNEIDIIEMIKDIIKKFDIHNIEFSPQFAELQILIKPFSLKRAIINIIDNAFKHGDKVWIDIRKDFETIKIIIEDNGPGIPKEEEDKIFKAFYRADYARNLNKAGAGLGLAISQNIILTHGGNIYVSKRNYKLNGASFVIELPS